MRRPATIASIALALAALAGVALASATTPRVARSKAVVKLRSCSLDEHSARYYARMRRVLGTRRMKLRFTLLERSDDVGRFRKVRAPELAHWHRSDLGVRSFGYSQGLRGLEDGSAYRMQVRYRWYGDDHKLLRATRRYSRICPMFVPLPNLRVRLIDAAPSDGGWRYRVWVTNAGLAPADNIPVQLSVDGAPGASRTIAHLEPGEGRRRTFYGQPACTQWYSATVDPDGAISETKEGDNSASARCVPLG